MAVGDTAQILIDHRHGMEQGIEQNGIGGLLSHAGQRQQLPAHDVGWLCSQPGQRGAVLPIEKGDKRLDGGSLAHHVSRGTNQASQLFLRNGPQPIEVHHIVLDQVRNGALHRAPGGVLREIRADDHLQRSLRRPPLLGAICGHELVVEIAQNARRRVGHCCGFGCRNCFFQPSNLAFNASASASAIMPLC